MQVDGLNLRNFLSFGEDAGEIQFSPLTTIVGPNDVGKTNIFRAFDLMHELLANPKFDLQPFYHRRELDRDLQVRMDLKLNEMEIQALTDFLACSSMSSGVTQLQNESQQRVEELQRKIFLDGGKELFGRLFSVASLVIAGPWLETNPPDVEIRIADKGREFSINRFGQIHQGRRTIALENFAQAIFETLRTTNPSVREFLDASRKLLPLPRSLSTTYSM